MVSHSGARRSRRNRSWPLDGAVLGPVLAEDLPVGGGDDPSTVTGFYDQAGHCRRIVADYPNGWKLTVRLNTKLEVTSASAATSLCASAPSRVIKPGDHPC